MTEAWVQRYGSEAGSQESAYKVVTDAAGNVIVAGTSTHNQTGSGSDMLVIKYSGAGVPLWTNRHDGMARAVAVDARGNVFVMGYSGLFLDCATIAYSSAGVPLWTNRYDGSAHGQDWATAIAMDGIGNIHVTGYSIGCDGTYDYATIAYSTAGAPLWTNRYNGPTNGDDSAYALAVDGNGNIYVTGTSREGTAGWSFATVKYAPASPRLTISLVGNQVRIAWPAYFPDWALRRARAVGGPFNDAGLPLMTEGEESAVYDAAAAGTGLYRLERSP